MIQKAWVSHVCDTYKISARKATGDTEVCHLYCLEMAMMIMMMMVMMVMGDTKGMGVTHV